MDIKRVLDREEALEVVRAAIADYEDTFGHQHLASPGDT
jgi:hypothetical protein